jgi:16S rRNA (guanine527-N7)-methyltransferase
MQNIARELGMGPIEILPARVETLVLRGERVGTFQVLLCRAVADITTTLRDFGPLLVGGGKILTFKGPGWRDDVGAAVAAGVLEDRKFHLEEVMIIPWTQGRILQIRKLESP